jgi:hypothetical protein
VIIVHDIIMDKREVVQHFNGHGRGNGIFIIIEEVFGCEQGDERSNSLCRQGKKIGDGPSQRSQLWTGNNVPEFSLYSFLIGAQQGSQLLFRN